MSSTYAELLHSSKSSHRELEAMVNDAFGLHPFATDLDLRRLGGLLPDFLALSQSFRYVLAAAQKDAFFEAMSEGRRVSDKIEMMNSVANYLLWDETGGGDLDLAHGKSKLPELLNLRRLHSELLRVDAEKLLGHPVAPRFSPATRHYITAFYRGLASTDEVVRCAHMVAFELHAGAVIDALWGSIAKATTVSSDELRYFALHVGGNDPAEIYHVEMTQRLIDRVVPASRREAFRANFLEAYAIHVAWCRALVEQRPPQTDRPEGEVWHKGGCHCGGVRFEVHAPAALDVVRCNCSICDMGGFLSLIVTADKFRLLAGEELLTSYQFNTQQAKHTFCRVCGQKAFYRPRSHPEGVSVNVRCLDRSTVSDLNVTNFDGQNWEQSVRELLRDCA